MFYRNGRNWAKANPATVTNTNAAKGAPHNRFAQAMVPFASEGDLD